MRETSAKPGIKIDSNVEIRTLPKLEGEAEGAIRFVAFLLFATALLAQVPVVRDELPAFVHQPLGLSSRVYGVDRLSEPSHGDLINQGLTAIRGFNI